MIQGHFAWTFATDDAATVQHVRDTFIPRIKADIEEMQTILDQCMAYDQATDATHTLAESIGRRKLEVEIAESRLQRASLTDSGQTPRLAVAIEGGLVQSVVSNDAAMLDSGLDVQIIDYDTEGVDDEDLLLVPQQDGSFSEALGHIDAIEKAGIDIAGIKPKIDS